MLFIILTTLLFWGIILFGFIWSLGNELKNTHRDTLNTIHFINLSQLHSKADVVEHLGAEHKALKENLKALIFAYKKDRSMDDVYSKLTPMGKNEREEVLLSLMKLLNSDKSVYVEIAEYYISTQIVWGILGTEFNKNPISYFIKHIRLSGMFDMLEKELRVDSDKVKSGGSFNLNLDYNFV